MTTASDQPATGRAERRTRRDARENDERVLAAAVVTMLRDGRQVPMAVIAAEAGVGVATLYRRYPSRDALLLALTERSFALLSDAVTALLTEDADGLTLLDRWWDRTLTLRDELVLPLRGGPPALSAEATRHQRRLHAGLEQILRTGHEDGTLRADLTLGDVVHYGTMLATPFHTSPDRHRILQRQKQLHLDGVAGPRASPRRREADTWPRT